MHGRRYYFTTVGAWRRHAAHCAETHFVVIGASTNSDAPEAAAIAIAEKSDALATVKTDQAAASLNASQIGVTDDATPILALIDADEGAHLAMENDAEFEELPHPLARTPVSKRVSTALAAFGIVRGDDTFTVAEKLARVNPLLRHRVF
ncbi:MAG: hypothetical protein ACYDD2_10910 [Candidatus Acidiferrales bacterium]